MNETTRCAGCGDDWQVDPQALEYEYADACPDCAIETAYRDALHYLTEGRLGFWSDPSWHIRMSGLHAAIDYIAFAEGLTTTAAIESIRERLLDTL